jgi:hypothetical protein
MRKEVLGIFSMVSALALLLLSGCLTQIGKPSRKTAVAKVPFGEFKLVELKAVRLSETFAGVKANQRALRKINEFLLRDLKTVFPDLVYVELAQDFSAAKERTLQITPVVKAIHLIERSSSSMDKGVVESSDVLLQVVFRDSASGAVIADPEFYRTAEAYAGVRSLGGADNKMFEDIAQDAANYSLSNK